MFEVAAEYLLVAIAVLIPVGLLAGILHVLIHPLSLDEVNHRNRPEAPAAPPQDGVSTKSDSGDTPPSAGRPRRAA